MKLLLFAMKEGEKGIVDSFDETSLSLEFIHDLMDHGLLPGTEIRIIHRPPLQDKLLIGAGAAEIALRDRDAKYIKIRTLAK